MAATPSSVIRQPAPREALQDAILEFQSILDDRQRHELQKMRAVPDADAILVFTAELDAAHRDRRGPSFASRLHSVLLAVRNFCGVADTFVSSHPEIAALAWGSVKLTMQVIANYASYYEATSDLFMRVGKLCPIFNEYLILYQTSALLRKSLLDFHASIVRCCKHVVEAVRRPWRDQLFQAFWKSFQQEFEPDIANIQKCSDDVERMIALAKAQTDSQEHRLQALEREEESIMRSTTRKFFSRTDERLGEMRELRLQKNARNLQKRKQQILDTLSTYDHLRLLKQSRRKRYRDTGSWIFQTPEFHGWLDGTVPLLWCSGKIGSGKTITTASVIDHLLSEKSADSDVSFFFVESGNQESLSANTIMRSILRQRLDPSQISEKVADDLENLDSFSGPEEFIKLLRALPPRPITSYILIDGVDECEKLDRHRLLTTLSSFAVPGGNIRLFLSSRAGLQEEIRKRFGTFNFLSMSCMAVNHDISTYIDDIITEKILGHELRIGDSGLEQHIKQALIDGAQGMFLWVNFQVDEICSQHCDADIRQTLKDLPASLTETFCRVLRRIISRGYAKEAQKIFPWIATSKRLLSLGQLREAIPIEIGQLSSKPERLYNDMEDIASWCENLIQLDEENQLVQFAHSTIGTFLLDGPPDPTLAGFRINSEEADHEIGEICVTYLNFNDFKTTIARRPKPIQLPSASQIAQSALGTKSKYASMISALGFDPASKPIDIRSLGSLGGNDSIPAYKVLTPGYLFLEYASTNWILHTRNFKQETSKTWALWKNMIICGHILAKVSWDDDAVDGNSSILNWAYHSRHFALLRLAASSDGVSDPQKSELMAKSAAYNDVTILNIFLEGKNSQMSIDKALRAAAEEGHVNIIEKLLAWGADVDAPSDHSGQGLQTALQLAAEWGHLNVVERLLAAGVNANARRDGALGSTVLQGAVRSGHLEVVERLLAVGADANAAPAAYSGSSSLQEAVRLGDLDIIERLLAAGADVNGAPDSSSGSTALQEAVGSGYLEIVERLIAWGADIDATGGFGGQGGQTALQIAARSGRLAMVERLLAAGADLDATNDYEGLTALQVATERGWPEVINRLRAAGAT